VQKFISGVKNFTRDLDERTRRNIFQRILRIFFLKKKPTKERGSIDKEELSR
jgi:hypothetical protein